MKKLFVGQVCVLIVALLLAAAPLVGFANSAQLKWSGADATGAIPADKDCPITVKSEKLIFNARCFRIAFTALMKSFRSTPRR